MWLGNMMKTETYCYRNCILHCFVIPQRRTLLRWEVRRMPRSLLPRMRSPLQVLQVWLWLLWKREMLLHQGWQEDLCRTKRWWGCSKWIQQICTRKRKSNHDDNTNLREDGTWKTATWLEEKDCSCFQHLVEIYVEMRTSKMLLVRVGNSFLI